MNRRKLVFLILLLFFTLTISATSEKAIITSFTSNKTCFFGFSKKNVTNVIQLTEAEKIPSGSSFELEVDPINGYWYSPLVYLYCQAFSRNGLEIFVYAPVLMEDGQSKLPYKIVEYDGYTWNKANVNSSDVYYYHYKEEQGEYTEPRVALSLPLKITVDSKDVDSNKKYSVNFKIQVSAK